MWLGHFIEHLMCIGGELEHPNALPSPARKNRALWSALLWRWGIYRQLIGPGWCHEPGLKAFGPGWCHEPGPMPPLVPAGGTNRDQRHCAARGQKFSPTSLVERGSEWFISPGAAAHSSSSQLQAYGPKLALCCLWAYWAFCGPESWPRLGF